MVEEAAELAAEELENSIAEFEDDEDRRIRGGRGRRGLGSRVRRSQGEVGRPRYHVLGRSILPGSAAEWRPVTSSPPAISYDAAVLDEIQRRVLWLATRIVDAANHDRDTGDGVKVGGHQASSASLVTVMTALYFALPGRPGPGQRQAARLAGLPRHPVPARQPGPLATCRRCGRSAASSRTRAGPRTRTASTSPPARWASAPRRRCSPRPPAAMSTRTSARGRAAGSSRSSATPSWTRATSGRRSPTRPPPAWATCCGSSTSTGSRWTGSCPASGSPSGSSSSARPAGTSSRPSTAGRCRQRSPSRAATACADWIDAMPNEHYQSLFGLDAAAVRERFLDGAPAEVAAVLRGHRRRRAGARWSPTWPGTTLARC